MMSGPGKNMYFTTMYTVHCTVYITVCHKTDNFWSAGTFSLQPFLS